MLAHERKGGGLRAVIYCRVSTAEQTTENQVDDLRAFITARGWTLAHEYHDEAVSGARERRPALDQLMQEARRRRFDVLVVWRLDRLGRNLRHLVTLIDELQALGIAFVSLAISDARRTDPTLAVGDSRESRTAVAWRCTRGRQGA